MKIAMFETEDGKGIVLTPENKFEREALNFIAPPRTAMPLADESELAGGAIIRRGEFYACQGGWDRQGKSEESLIVVRRKKDEVPAAPFPVTRYPETESGGAGGSSISESDRISLVDSGQKL